jgi:hypothetical protein
VKIAPAAVAVVVTAAAAVVAAAAAAAAVAAAVGAEYRICDNMKFEDAGGASAPPAFIPRAYHCTHATPPS